MKTEDIKTLTDRHAAIKAECEKLGAEIERLKAGGSEWPKKGDKYWYIQVSGGPCGSTWDGFDFEIEARARGNVYRTVEAAREADEQIQFLRRAMTAGDLAPTDSGHCVMIYNSRADNDVWKTCDGFRKFSTIKARDAFIESEGGVEVFRQKLAKGWPV